MGREAVDRQHWVLEAVDRHEVRLLRFATRLLGDKIAARDAVQHAFLRLCGQSPERLGGHEGPWLLAVCRNHIVDVVRRRNAVSPGNDTASADWEGREPDPASAVERSDLAQSINRLVDRLPLQQREAIVLWSEGFDYREIARITDTSEGNVRVIVHRALKTLRRQVGIGEGCEADAHERA
jgi:RNA polymerase sigma factor (sigma-70 family)